MVTAIEEDGFLEIKVKSGNISAIKADALIVFTASGHKRLSGVLADIDKTLGGAIERLLKQGEIKGKAGEMTTLHTLGKLPASRVMIAGLGDKKSLDSAKVRQAAATACRLAKKRGLKHLSLADPSALTDNISAAETGQALAEGAILGGYAFEKYHTGKDTPGRLNKITIVPGGRNRVGGLKKGVLTGQVIAGAIIVARDFVNEPSNNLTASDLATAASLLAAECGISAEILEKAAIEELGMGCLLGVNRGSHEPPRFIILKYLGRDSDAIDLALVGKGIMFDTGGISLKPAASMDEMKSDMAGGASVIAAISAIALLKPAINVVALVPATDNMPGGNAYKPGDVLRAMNGKTVEVLNTDAEGRLALADALSYAVDLKARKIVDVATLTGACVIALGETCTGAMGNNRNLMNRLLAAAGKAGETTWQLPMFGEYAEQIKSDIADIKNTGGRGAGTITAGKFLEEFVGKTPWVHLDIAGTAWSKVENGDIGKGASGAPVRTLVNLALKLAE